MTLLRDYLRLIRWSNLLFIIILLVLLEKGVIASLCHSQSMPEQLPLMVLVVLIASVVLIAAGGYVINDYFDIKIDRINRPDTLIITRTISKDSAMRLFYCLTVVGVLGGLWCAWICRSWSLLTVFVITPGLLWFYSASYKRQLIVGNLIIAFLAASVPLILALANMGYMYAKYSVVIYEQDIIPLIFRYMCGFSIFSFLCTWCREIVKDLQDQEGDRELECHTLPVVFGERTTKIIVSLLIVVIVMLAAYAVYGLLPFDRSFFSLSGRYWLCGMLIPMCCELWLLWTAKIPTDYRNAQLLIKIIMAIGMLYSIVIMLLL